MDSPVMVFLGRVADLIILNLIATVFCIPVVTAGASLTALYYVTLKMVKDEESYLFRSFWKSFKENFRQATVIWLLILLFAAIIGLDIYMMRVATQIAFPKVLKIMIGVVVVMFLMTLVYVFPVLARFENTVSHTIKNAFLMSIISLPKTLLILILHAVMILPLLFPRYLPAVMMFGLSGPAFLSSYLLRSTFRKFEPQEETEGGVAPEDDSMEQTEE